MPTTKHTKHYVNAFAIRSPFGTFAYQIGSADEKGTVPLYVTPAGDMEPADTLTYHGDSTVWASGSATINDDATLEPRTPGSILRQHKPLTINGKHYVHGIRAVRLPADERHDTAHYMVTGGTWETLTDSAREKLAAWMTEHDEDLYRVHLPRLAFTDAHNAYADAVTKLTEATEAANSAAILERAAWGTLQRVWSETDTYADRT